MPATVRQYELVYIVPTDRSEDQLRATIDKYNNIVTTQGGTLERTDIWERRRLAYPIKGQSEGVYIVSIFRSLPPVEAELRRVFLISEDTLRFIIVRPDEEIDATVPSVQPRDFGSRPPMSAPAPAAPVAAVAASGEPAEAAAPEAPAASVADVPEIAASEAPAEAEPAGAAA